MWGRLPAGYQGATPRESALGGLLLGEQQAVGTQARGERYGPVQLRAALCLPSQLTTHTVSYPLVFTCLTAFAVAALLWADHHEQPKGQVFWKLTASTGFVGVALALGALQSRYGMWLMGALLFGWLGDAFLLSRLAWAFLAGLGAFLLSHLLFAGAFAQGNLSSPAMGAAAPIAVVVGCLVLHGLWPHTPAHFKLPVLIYVVVIMAMCVTAAGHAVAGGRWVVLAGALLFAASDIAVARDRFVKAERVNRLWGWPTYFAAQLLLAWSAFGVR